MHLYEYMYCFGKPVTKNRLPSVNGEAAHLCLNQEALLIHQPGFKYVCMSLQGLRMYYTRSNTVSCGL